MHRQLFISVKNIFVFSKPRGYHMTKNLNGSTGLTSTSKMQFWAVLTCSFSES